MTLASKAAAKLFEVAESQQGFFTAKQAKASGYAENTHPYHVHTGSWIRAHRGIYRLALFPVTEHPDLVQWSLWSKDRKEKTQGIFSHETALRLHELSDVNPAKLHMTVPLAFRRSTKIPGVLVLHYSEIPESEIEEGQGFRYTKPLRTILDIAEANTMEQSLLNQAILQALQRGIISEDQLQRAELAPRMRGLVNELFRKQA